MANSVDIVIPARMKSERLPNKPLIEINGKTLIQRTFERVSAVADKENIFIATESKRIAEHAEDFGARVIMTSPDCLTGTDRVCEAAKHLSGRSIVNVQGDEPIMPLKNITSILHFAENYPGDVGIGYSKITSEDEFKSPNVPKCVFSEDKRLIYMSRSGIPGNKDLRFKYGFKQICVYSFSRSALQDFEELGRKSSLEASEDIEILRLLEKQRNIKMIEMDRNSVAVDTPVDVERVAKIIAEQGEGIETYNT